MDKFQEKLAEFTAQLKEMDMKVDAAALEGVAKAVGPNMYKSDASLVSTSDDEEVQRVVDNFIGKKLGITDEKKAAEAIEKAKNAFGSSNRNKTRVVFYYIVAEHLGKLGMFK